MEEPRHWSGRKLRLREPGEHWIATVDAAVRFAVAMSPQRCRGIDYGAESLHDGGWSQRKAIEVYTLVLSALNCLGREQREALEMFAFGASLEQVARKLKHGERLVRTWIWQGREEVAHRLRGVGLMEGRD